MDPQAAWRELTRVTAASGSPDQRARAGLALLRDLGAQAAGLSERPGLTLADVIATVTAAPQSDARRDFAVLLVRAHGLTDLLPIRGPLAVAMQRLIESALLNPLRRAGYPFDAGQYERREALIRLHATIDEYLRPPEPSFPTWLQGLTPPNQD